MVQVDTNEGIDDRGLSGKVVKVLQHNKYCVQLGGFGQIKMWTVEDLRMILMCAQENQGVVTNTGIWDIKGTVELPVYPYSVLPKLEGLFGLLMVGSPKG